MSYPPPIFARSEESIWGIHLPLGSSKLPFMTSTPSTVVVPIVSETKNGSRSAKVALPWTGVDVRASSTVAQMRTGQTSVSAGSRKADASSSKEQIQKASQSSIGISKPKEIPPQSYRLAPPKPAGPKRTIMSTGSFRQPTVEAQVVGPPLLLPPGAPIHSFSHRFPILRPPSTTLSESSSASPSPFFSFTPRDSPLSGTPASSTGTQTPEPLFNASLARLNKDERSNVQGTRETSVAMPESYPGTYIQGELLEAGDDKSNPITIPSSPIPMPSPQETPGLSRVTGGSKKRRHEDDGTGARKKHATMATAEGIAMSQQTYPSYYNTRRAIPPPAAISGQHAFEPVRSSPASMTMGTGKRPTYYTHHQACLPPSRGLAATSTQDNSWGENVAQAQYEPSPIMPQYQSTPRQEYIASCRPNNVLPSQPEAIGWDTPNRIIEESVTFPNAASTCEGNIAQSRRVALQPHAWANSEPEFPVTSLPGYPQQNEASSSLANWDGNLSPSPSLPERPYGPLTQASVQNIYKPSFPVTSLPGYPHPNKEFSSLANWNGGMDPPPPPPTTYPSAQNRQILNSEAPSSNTSFNNAQDLYLNYSNPNSVRENLNPAILNRAYVVPHPQTQEHKANKYQSGPPTHRGTLSEIVAQPHPLSRRVPPNYSQELHYLQHTSTGLSRTMQLQQEQWSLDNQEHPANTYLDLPVAAAVPAEIEELPNPSAQSFLPVHRS